MANQLKVQEQEAIANLSRLGWGIRRIARELGLSRNTVRSYVRSLSPLSEADVIAEEIVKASALSPPRSGNESDPLSTAGSATAQNPIDPLSTAGNTGRKSLCADHAELIVAKFEEGLTAQRIYQDLRVEISFSGSYQSVKRYVVDCAAPIRGWFSGLRSTRAKRCKWTLAPGRRCSNPTAKRGRPGSFAWS